MQSSRALAGLSSSGRFTVRRALAVAITLALPSLSSAAVRNWTSDVSGNWTDATKWDVLPVASDTLSFNGTAGGTVTATNDFAAGTTFGPGNAAGAILGNAIQFSGPDQFILAGNDIKIAGNIANTSGSLQTINLNMVQTGLTSPPFGYNISGGAGGLLFNGNIGTTAVANDLNVQAGAGTVTFAGTDNRIAAGFSDAASTTAVTGNYRTAFFATYNGAVTVGDGTNAALMGIGSDVRFNGGLTVNSNAKVTAGAYIASGVNTYTINVNGSGLIAPTTDFNLADAPGSVGTMNVNGTGTTAAPNVTAGTWFIGRNGAATLNFNGGQANVGGFRVGTETASVATANLSGGAINTTAFVSIGANGKGTLNVSGNGAFTTNQDFNISDVGVSQGAMNISGNAIVKAGTLYVGKGNGNAGTASVVTGTTIQITGPASGIVTQSGGQFIQNGGGDYRIAGNSNGATVANQERVVGMWDMTGGTFTEGSNFQIGYQGAGRLSIGSGATVTSTGGFASIGRLAGSNGIVDINGGTWNHNSAGTRFIVGEAGLGILNVRNGGVLNIASLTNGIAVPPAANAALNSNLQALTLTNADTAGIEADVNLGTGGTIVTRSVGSAGHANAVSNFNFLGGTLRANATNPTFMENTLSHAIVTTAGGTIDSNGFDIGIAQPLVDAAGTSGVQSLTGAGTGYKAAPIVKISGGGGTGASAIANIDSSGNLTGFTVTNPGSGYTSTPTVTVFSANGGSLTGGTIVPLVAPNTGGGGITKAGGGFLALNGANTYTGTTAVNAGALGGTGSVTSAVNIAGGAAIDPGLSSVVGTFTTGSVSLASGAAMSVEINGATADLLAVNGTINLSAAGDTLNVSDLAATPSIAFPYTIATYTTGLVGTFNATNLPQGVSVVYGPAVGPGTITLVPEPASLTALAGLAAMAFGRRRRA